MTFEPNRFYFRSGTGGTIYALNWDTPFTVTFYLRMPNRTAGHITVSLLEKAPDLPYGITGSTGPWYIVPEDADILKYPSPDALTLAEWIRRAPQSNPTLNMGLPWPVDKRDFGV